MTFPSVYEMTNPLTTVRKQHFWEYFSGATLNSRWTATTTGSSTGVIADSVNGGYLITTGSSNNDRVEIDFGQKRQFSKTGSRFIIVATMGQTTNLISQLGFMDNVHASYTNKAICGIWTAAASVKFLWQSTGTGTSTNTSSTLTTDTSPHVFEGVLSGSNFVGTIDGTITTTISTNLPDLDMQPHIDMIAKESASKTLNVRYCEAYNT